MKESLIRVEWVIESEPSEDGKTRKYWIEIDHNEETNEVITVDLTGLDSNSEYWIESVGTDILTKEDYDIIRDHIKEIINPSDLGTLIKRIGKPIKQGDFFIVVSFDDYQSNHPLDPVEWDVDINFLGILGKQVKLVY
jgi:hypothetical protein